MTDIRQTPLWAKYLERLGWRVEKLDGTYIQIKKLSLFGSYIKITRCGWPLDFKKIDQIAKQNNALFVKITPKIRIDQPNAAKVNEMLLKNGYIKDYWTVSVAKRLAVDLAKTESELLKSFSRKTRQYINLAKRSGVTVIQSNDIDLCYRLYLETAKRNGFKPVPFADVNIRTKVFKKAKKARLFFALAKDKKAIATLLVLLNPAEKLAFCAVAGTSDVQRNLRASYLLHWKGMLFVKKLGYKVFDFDGIYDDRSLATRNWGGFTQFKKGFGGEEISYLGAYVKSNNVILQSLLTFAEFIGFLLTGQPFRNRSGCG